MGRNSMKTLTKVEPQTLAAQLWGIEQELERLTEMKDEIRNKLLKSLSTQGVKFIKLENGDSYTVAERNNLVIKNEISATAWAMENPESRMQLNKTKALEVAKLGKSKIFGVEKTYSLRISRAKNTNDENSN